MVSSPDTPLPSVSPGRPPPPSVKNTSGSCELLGELEEPVLLAVVLQPLRAGQDGVVVGHDDGLVTVDRADAADHAVGRRALDQLLQVAPPSLGGDRQRRRTR